MQAELIQLVKLVSANYGKKLTEQQIELFSVMANQWGIEKFKRGVMAHMQDPEQGVYFPNMAHISRKINGSSNPIESQARMQWMNVERAIRECGSYRTPTFLDPVTAATVSTLGGWPHVCSRTIEQLTWMGKEFEKLYNDYATQPVEFLPSNVRGRIEEAREQSKDAETLAKLGIATIGKAS